MWSCHQGLKLYPMRDKQRDRFLKPTSFHWRPSDMFPRFSIKEKTLPTWKTTKGSTRVPKCCCPPLQVLDPQGATGHDLNRGKFMDMFRTYPVDRFPGFLEIYVTKMKTFKQLWQVEVAPWSTGCLWIFWVAILRTKSKSVEETPCSLER